VADVYPDTAAGVKPGPPPLTPPTDFVIADKNNGARCSVEALANPRSGRLQIRAPVGLTRFDVGIATLIRIDGGATRK